MSEEDFETAMKDVEDLARITGDAMAAAAVETLPEGPEKQEVLNFSTFPTF